VKICRKRKKEKISSQTEENPKGNGLARVPSRKGREGTFCAEERDREGDEKKKKGLSAQQKGKGNAIKKKRTFTWAGPGGGEKRRVPLTM